MSKVKTRERLAVVGRRKPSAPEAKAQEAKAHNTPQLAEVPPAAVEQRDLGLRLAVGGSVLAAGVWAYWSTLKSMVHAWETEPDYSHGYLVLPAALYFLWVHRKSAPAVAKPGWVVGLSLVGLSLAVRVFAAAFFYESIDGWSMLLWLAGVVALVFGTPALKWALPSIAFLVFMVPLPFRLEGALSLPLQRIATKASCWTLQLLGQPAIAEGNTILMGDHRLEVEQACSGLRLFVSILALAFAYLVLVRREWWEKALLVLSVVPIAIIANAARIVATGLLYEYVSTDAAKKFSHDLAGWAMIPLAAVLFGATLWYLGKLFREQEQLDASDVIRQIKI